MNVEVESPYKKMNIYTDIADGVVNKASMFLYSGMTMLGNKNGIISMIIPKSFYSVQSWSKIRNILLQNHTLIAINDVGKAFEKVGLEQGIVIMTNKRIQNHIVSILKDGLLQNQIPQKYFEKNQIILSSVTSEIFNIINKIEQKSILLGTIADMPRGITEKSNVYTNKIAKDYIQVLGGTNIKQYLITDGNKRKPNRYTDINLRSLENKNHIFQQKRICYQNLMSSLPKVVATIVPPGMPTDDTLNNLLLNNDIEQFQYESILGILNSRLCTFYLKYRLLNCAQLTVHLDKPYIGKLPIPTVPSIQQKPLIDLVDKILTAKKENPQADTSALEHQIDLLVYHLYGLTFEEAKIIDENLTEEEFNITLI